MVTLLSTFINKTHFEMTDENKIKFLFNCANTLASETHTKQLLKSYYITTCRKLAKHNVQLPGDAYGKARMCERCGNPWNEGNYQLKLQPQQLLATAKRRKLVNKLDTANEKQLKGTLTRSQRKRAKWLKKCLTSKMQVNCAVCRHKTLLELEKPKKKHTTLKPIQVEVTTEESTVASKKKKKSKTKANKAIAIPPAKNAPTASSKNPAKSTNTIQSKKEKKKTKAQTVSSSSSAQTQSKTQKQNALLQLAAQLKKQANKTAPNRLEAFLK